MPRSLSIYIHLPFCEKRCDYCDFYSTLDFPALNTRYRSTLTENIAWAGRQSQFASRPVQSVFLGGGTPNLYKPDAVAEWIDSIRTHFLLSPDAEISMEMNPEFIQSSAQLEEYHRAGVNRLSVGLQSLIPAELELLGRIHSAEKALQALNVLRSSSFSNWSADIIYSLPGQTVPDLQQTLNRVLQFDPPHISAYSLTREAGTRYDFRLTQGELSEPDEESQLQLFLILRSALGHAGYRHYEISNFAREGFEARHNLHYWRFGDYLGLGAGAHGKIGFRHFFYPDDLQDYLRRSSDGDFEPQSETLEPLSALLEYAVFKLRTAEGILRSECSTQRWTLLHQALTKVQSKLGTEYFLFEESGIRCNFEAWLVLDSLLLELADMLEREAKPAIC